MKVQRKVSPHREWDVVEQSRSFYIVSDGSPNGEGLHYTLSKAEYEPVEEWVDVDMSTLTFKESEDDAYLCDGVLILFKRTWWANGKGMSDSGEDAETYRITGLQRKVKR